MTGGLGKTREESRQNADSSPTGVIYRFADAEINVARATIRRGEQPVALRPKTYQFLLFLLERHERVVGKDELIAGLWGGEPVSDDVLVRSMGELRKAFADDPKDPQVFKTYPKIGYGMGVRVEKVARLAPVLPIGEEAIPRHEKPLSDHPTPHHYGEGP